MNLLAIEIGGSKLQLFAGTDDGQILDRRRFPVERAAGGEGIRRQIAAALPELVAKWQPRAVGIGYGGPVNWRSGKIAKSYHIEGWSDFPLTEWVTEQIGLPAFIDNDANVAALGEAHHGAGKGANPVFYVNMGSGVGGGLIVDGHIYHGAPPGEVEIGHLRLDRDGTIIEQRCAGWSVDKRIREDVQAHPESLLAEFVRSAPPGCEARHLSAALAQCDPRAEYILGETMDWLAFGLSHVVQLFHPEIIVVGGGLSLLGEPLRARLAEAVPRFVMDAFLPGPRIALAGLGEDAVPVGALTLAAKRTAME